MRMIRLGGLTVVAVVLASTSAVIGCSADSGGGSPSSTSSTSPTLAEGLTVLSSDPAVGMSAAFKQNGRVVYLQTRVGPLKMEGMRQSAPDEPQNEMDARVVDQEGRTFRLIIGGDGLIDPSWAKDMNAAGHITSAAEGAQRQADFLLARDGANALAAQAGPELRDHVYHLTNMTRVVPLEDATLVARAKTLATQVPAEVAYGSNGCSSNYQQGDLYTKPMNQFAANLASVAIGFCGGGGVPSGAQHSSVIGWNYNGCGSYWDQEIVSCNHGTCANSSAMSYSCSSVSNYWTSKALSDYYAYETSTGISTHGGCNGSYGFAHVCNDDSAYELMQINESTRYTSYGDSNSFYWNSFTCNEGNGCWSINDISFYAPYCP